MNFMWHINNNNVKGWLTHLSLASLLWDIGKQKSPRCDAAERGVPSGAFLFAWRNFIEKMRLKLKITSNTPKNESGLSRFIMMGKSIRQIWVKGFINHFKFGFLVSLLDFIVLKDNKHKVKTEFGEKELFSFDMSSTLKAGDDFFFFSNTARFVPSMYSNFVTSKPGSSRKCVLENCHKASAEGLKTRKPGIDLRPLTVLQGQ